MDEDSYSSHGEEQGIDLLQDSVAPVATPAAAAAATTILRPGFQVTQGVSYYNLNSLYILYGAHVTEGIPIPAIFLPPMGEHGFDKPNVEFRF